MFLFSACFALILLALANHAVRRSSEPRQSLLLFSFVGIFLPLLFSVFLPAVALQCLLIPLVYALWRWARGSQGAFTAMSTATFVLALLFSGLLILREDLPRKERLRESYPFESMETRVPSVRPIARLAALPTPALSRLTEMEETVQTNTNHSRTDYLRSMHEYSVREFLDSPAFGVGRMGTFTGLHLLGWGDTRRHTAVPQPGLQDATEWESDSPGDLPEMRPGEDKQLSRMHSSSVLDFVNPRGFGWMKDRRNVVGFLPHQFSQVPKPGERWAVDSVELVSLLMHNEPSVYLSANLPKMDALRGVPTRPLDAVEAVGLKALQEGEDQFVRPTENGLRMLGSLRAVKQCVDCHGGERGDLLGAFSYTLRPAR